MAEHRENENDREQHEGKEQHQSSRSGSSQQRDESGRGSERQADSSDLKQREYRGKEGNVHHHPHEDMERHGKKGGSGSDRS